MRRVLAFLLLVLGSVATVLAATSVWASRTLLDETGWEQRAVAVAKDPAVSTAISDAILQQVPSKVSAAQQQQLRVAVATAMQRPDVQEAWARLNRSAAAAVLAVARGEPGEHVNAQGDVVLDAEPLLQSLAAQKGPLADVIARHQARQIVLVEASKLEPLRRATSAGDVAPPVLIGLAVILLGLGAMTARSPAGAIAITAFCLLIGAAAVLVAFLAARDSALERAPSQLADTVITSTFQTAERPLAMVVAGAMAIALGLVAVVSGLRARARARTV
jgi:hypothetical protein